MGHPIDVSGKVVIVTGASRGIGEAIAKGLLQCGAKVAIASRKQEGIEAAAARLRSEVPGAQVQPIVAHMGDAAAVERLVNEAEAALGPLDAVVNNAATNPYFGPFLGVEERAWDKTFEVNLKGPFALARMAAQRFMEGGRTGSIIGVSSVAGIRGAPFQGVYAMTKAAMISMTQTLAVELGPQGVRVNAIAPGFVDTKLASAVVQNESLNERVVGLTPLKRIAQPEEIAGAVVYLVSDASSYMTGHTMVIDGGMTIGGF